MTKREELEFTINYCESQINKCSQELRDVCFAAGEYNKDFLEVAKIIAQDLQKYSTALVKAIDKELLFEYTDS